MKSEQKGFAGVLVLVWLAVIAVAGFGWVWNIVKIIGSNLDVITGILVVRVAGVFVPPLGIVMGYL